MFDSINRSDGISLYDLAAILGAALMVLGTIYGFVLKWGPVICGLAGLLLGAGIGLFLDLTVFGKLRNTSKASSPEVVLM